MKTSQFENTIRRKLESIQPDFQEADWAKMQDFMQAHTPPSIWQQYGSWIGYAAAASVTTVMAFLYFNQLSQNNNLLADVKELKTQIEVIREQPALSTDTVYLVQSPTGKEQTEYVAVNPQSSDDQHIDRQPDRKTKLQYSLPVNDLNKIEQKGYSSSRKADPPVFSKALAQSHDANSGKDIHGDQSGFSRIDETAGISPAGSGPLHLAHLTTKTPVNVNNGSFMSRKMHYNLADRLSTRQVNKITRMNTARIASVSADDRQLDNETKAENVIPQLNIKTPYRFGGGVQVEGNGTVKTVVGEVLVGKKFSIAAGISWLKVKPMEFLTDKIFKDKIRKDFRRSHPGEVPLALDVYNIRVNPTLVQIPLTVAFRNNIKDNWAYYAGVGTNVTVSSREKVSFDCVAPNKEYFSKEFDKKTSSPVIGSAILSVGIEKSWHPLVVQAEGYVYTYFSPLTPLSNTTGPGVKLKVLYQIGGKM